jgi:hypothetical protein
VTSTVPLLSVRFLIEPSRNGKDGPLLTHTTESNALDDTGTVFDVPARARLERWDWIILAILLLSGIATAVSAMRAAVAPKEDALMLLRYSEHLAQGFGITWNVGEKPVEGATDFLYMVMVAVAYPIFCTSWIVSVAQLLMYLDGCRMGREELGNA